MKLTGSSKVWSTSAASYDMMMDERSMARSTGAVPISGDAKEFGSSKVRLTSAPPAGGDDTDGRPSLTWPTDSDSVCGGEQAGPFEFQSKLAAPVRGVVTTDGPSLT